MGCCVTKNGEDKIWTELRLTNRNSGELLNEKFRNVIESSWMRRAGRVASMGYDIDKVFCS